MKDRLTSIIRNAFIFKNGNRKYKYLVLGHEEIYFVKEHSDSKNKYSEDDIIKMFEFLADNILVVSAFGPELGYRLRVAQPTLMDVTRYFWYTLILLYMFVYYIFMTSPLWLAVGPQSI